MIEIFLVFGSAFWFAKEANSIGKSGLLWGFIGVISFYIPVLIFSIFIYPILIYGTINPSNQLFFTILGIILNILVGATSLLLVRRKLLKMSKNIETEQLINRKINQEKRVCLNDLKKFANVVGAKGYSKETNKYIGTIFEINENENICKLKNDFNKEYQYSFNDILINPVE